MRIKHRRLQGGMDEDRGHPPRGVPNHMLPYGLRRAGMRGNALTNGVVKGACRQTKNQRKNDYTNKCAAPRKPRVSHEIDSPFVAQYIHQRELYRQGVQKQGYESHLTPISSWM